jgi:flavin reductase (DIM6/NTAB) family NADH-FMN oxidoreductase RutF
VLDAEAFRRIVGSFPTGVAVVTCLDDSGAPRGLTTNAFTSVSLDPPMLLVCIDKTSNTLPALRGARAFAVNFLAAGRDELARRFATKAADKFSGVRWEPSETAAGAPLLADDAIAWAECTLANEIDAGDHVVLLARVEGGRARDEGAPLMFFRRAYGAWS